ncbi:acetate--CoA ligase family protein [Paenirhodobacter sp.]|uniref:acetate--CoA ligase family protein n=1 Tax=Paenirhodobacter sp. TaxID=1965326 RepID=UPI003B40D528
MEPLQRLFMPKSVAVIGGGAWCAAVIRQCRATGFTGPIWPVHPTRAEAFRSVADLPGVPDAAFVGVNRELTVSVVAELSAMGCGGAVCFAAGFREASVELADGAALQERLVAAAGRMRILGPNCYGFVNALDHVSLWPDLHGLVPVESGVAIVGQSSNVLINLTMQRRGLPIAAVIAAGNQAQVSMADIGRAMLDDPRVTALGLHIEGLTDLPAFAALAAHAADLRKPVVVLKVGRSAQAQQAAVSHTASLAGSDVGARALFARLGLWQVDSPTELLEALKIAHVTGGLASARVVSASCSGGEASIIADLGLAQGVAFPPLGPMQQADLRAALGPRVALANPLDYNTYIWDDGPALARTFAAMLGPDVALGCVVLDYPRAEMPAPAWDKVLDAVAQVRRDTGHPMAIVSLMAEGLPEAACRRLVADGVVPLCGMADALAAIRAAATPPGGAAPLLPLPGGPARVVGEAEAKALLAAHGLPVPRARRTTDPAAVAAEIGFPVVLKGEGIAHKTEAGAVALNLRDAGAVARAAATMPAQSFLVEEMVTGGIAELLIGVMKDPAHGFVLTLGLGGVLTELLRDTVSLIVPASEADLRAALGQLRIAPLLNGYRGKPGVALDAVIAAIMAVQAFVTAHAAAVEEVEINPLIATPERAVAADALIRMGGTE